MERKTTAWCARCFNPMAVCACGERAEPVNIPDEELARWRGEGEERALTPGELAEQVRARLDVDHISRELVGWLGAEPHEAPSREQVENVVWALAMDEDLLARLVKAVLREREEYARYMALDAGEAMADAAPDHDTRGREGASAEETTRAGEPDDDSVAFLQSWPGTGGPVGG